MFYLLQRHTDFGFQNTNPMPIFILFLIICLVIYLVISGSNKELTPKEREEFYKEINEKIKDEREHIMRNFDSIEEYYSLYPEAASPQFKASEIKREREENEKFMQAILKENNIVPSNQIENSIKEKK